MRSMRNAALLLLAICGADAAGIESARASIDKQRQSVERQMASVARQIQRWPAAIGTRTAPAKEPDPPVFACEKIAPSQLAVIADDAAARHGVSSALIRAVIQQESGGNPCAVSSKGALGLMQIMPQVANELQLTQPFDPVGNIDAGGRLLKQLLTRFNSDLPLALAAYNAGAGAVERAGGVPNYPETQGYVSAILTALKR